MSERVRAGAGQHGRRWHGAFSTVPAPGRGAALVETCPHEHRSRHAAEECARKAMGRYRRDPEVRARIDGLVDAIEAKQARRR